MNIQALAFAPLLAYGHDIGGMLVHMLIHSFVWHAVGSLFRGQGIVGSILIGVVAAFVLVMLKRRFGW